MDRDDEEGEDRAFFAEAKQVESLLQASSFCNLKSQVCVHNFSFVVRQHLKFAC